MKRLSTYILITIFVIIQALPFAVLAQTKNTTVTDFIVTAPTEVKINEAFDVTIKAVGADGKKINNYEGTVYFDNTNRPSTDLVLPSFGDNGYTFTLSDQGEHTFAKGFTLKKTGVYDLDVYDLDTGADGYSKTFKVTAIDTGTPTTTTSDITITEPSDAITVSTKSIPVGGVSKATSKINILLNGKQVTTTQTDAEGKYTTTIDDLVVGNNELVAEVLDGTGKVMGTSQKTTIKYSTEVPKFTSLTIKEGVEFIAGSSINLVGTGDQNLRVVQVKIGDKMALLDEDKNNLGTYTGVFKTSEFEGEFSAVVAIESQLGTKVEVKDLAKFRTVTAKIENIETKTTTDKKVRFTFNLTPDLEQIANFEIKYGTESGKYTKSVLTYDKAKIQEDGKYTWYIPNITAGEYFFVITAIGKDKQLTSINSGEQTFTVALDAAPTCFVEKISGIRLEQSTKTYSVIAWDKQPDISKYQIFKRNSGGEFAMIDEIEANKYRVNIDMTTGVKIFEDFKVRGICKNGGYTGEGDFSESVKVQTGPELIIFFALFIASGIAFILARRGYLN